MKLSVESQVRFYQKIAIIPFHTCWEWIGDKNEKGYGRFNNKKAHRLMYEMTYSLFPSNLHVLHKCDNPSCVNPEHLFLGTHSDNMRDKVSKGRDHNKTKTHCRHGHIFAGENLHMKSDGSRRCMTCEREWQRRNYHKNKCNK